MATADRPQWRISSRSGIGESCVEVAPWRTSTYSGDGENWVEVAPAPDRVLVRHSRHPDAGTIEYPLPAWAAFVHEAVHGLPGTDDVVTVTTIGTDTLLRSRHTDVELRFDQAEWTAFIDGARDGEFDFAADPAPGGVSTGNDPRRPGGVATGLENDGGHGDGGGDRLGDAPPAAGATPSPVPPAFRLGVDAGLGTLPAMTHPSDHEARLTALESRVEEVAVDAAAARHLAAARDRDLADFGVKVNANRSAINALGVQTAGRFDKVDRRLDQIDLRFTQIDLRLDQIDQRLDQIDLRFTQIDQRLDQIDQRFTQIDQRLDQIDQRFTQVDLRFDRLEQRVDQLEDKVDTGFEETRRGFAEMRGKLDQTAAGQQQIVDLLTTIISEKGDS